MNIALLDNDDDQARLVEEVLTAAGHRCHRFQEDEQLLARLRAGDTQLLLIDFDTAGTHAIDLMKTMRSALSPDMPILLFARRGNEDDLAAARAAGASDYMIKPLRRGELLTRVSILLKMTYPALTKPEHEQFSDYVFQLDSARVSVAGAPVELTQKEFSVALLFFRHLGRPLSRAYIAEAVWPHDADLTSRTIDTHVSRVRTKLGLRPENGFRLVPVYSYGYQLEQLLP